LGSEIQFLYGKDNYLIKNFDWSIGEHNTTTQTQVQIVDNGNKTRIVATFTYIFDFIITNKFTISKDSENTEIRSKYVEPTEFKWSIDSNGDAIFHNIQADGGMIAGWFIDNEKIYQTINGERDGTIKT
jgi:hypothetical protein